MTTVLYNLFFSLTGNFLSQITQNNPLQEFQADRTLLSTSAPHHQVASIVEPTCLNELVHGIGTPSVFNIMPRRIYPFTVFSVLD